MSVSLNVQAVEVPTELATMVARIADLNEIVALAEKENKELKATITEAVGGLDMVVLFPEGIRVTHNGVGLATVKATTRTTVTADRVNETVADILRTYPQIEDLMPEIVQALTLIGTTAGKATTFSQVRPK
jgi:hypothetical protein